MVGMKSVGKLPTIRRTRILGTPNLAKLPGHYHARAPLPRRRHRPKKGGLVTYLEVVTAQSAALTNDRTAVQILTHKDERLRAVDQSSGRGGVERFEPAAGKRA